VHALKAKTRLGSTALTGGAANPVLSAAEDFSAFGLATVGVLLPLVALILVVGAALAARGVARALTRR
jgi:hypothetical protein